MTAMHNNPKELRKFGLMVGGIFCVIGLWPAVVRGLHMRSWALVVGVVLLGLGAVAPKSLGPVYRIWMLVGEALGWVNTRILLGVVFYVIITPLGLFRRALGHDPMGRRYAPALDSYRAAKRPRPAAHMRRQF